MKTFYFYDLETSGVDPKQDRIMQFAGQRTDMNLNLIGEPDNFLIKLTDDILPSPDALMVTKITPQKTLEDGLTEAEAAQKIYEIFTSGTTIVGFNNIRFDDEFIRYLMWRNFHDPYEWSWKDDRSRWDLLDVVRMTRALRPEGIVWPFDTDGKPTNRLELITASNGLNHYKAHDALSDVMALIDVAKLIKLKQEKIFEYLLSMREKSKIKELVNLENKKPFIYVSGKYSGDYNKATIAFPIAPGPNSSVLVYDLRHDPDDFLNLSQKDLLEKIIAPWEKRKDPSFVNLPVKKLAYNKCPAVAEIIALETNDGWNKISINKTDIQKNIKKLIDRPDFSENIRTIYEKLDDYKPSTDADSRLYESFLPDKDKIRIEAVQNATETELADMHPEFIDDRLPELLLRYKARSFPNSLSEEECLIWEKFRADKIKAQIPKFLESMRRLDKTHNKDKDRFVLEELQLYLESVLPVEY